jgi:transcription elongation GreA/GreB family factor
MSAKQVSGKKNSAPYLLTKVGFDKLKSDIAATEQELKETRKLKGEAYETGGNAWHDNFAFEQFIEKERMLIKRLAELKEKLNRAVVKERKPQGGGEKVQLGSRVLVEFEDGSRKEFMIVDSETADPDRGTISYRSPLGAALMNCREGNGRSYTAGGKTMKVKVLMLR